MSILTKSLLEVRDSLVLIKESKHGNLLITNTSGYSLKDFTIKWATNPNFSHWTKGFRFFPLDPGKSHKLDYLQENESILITFETTSMSSPGYKKYHVIFKETEKIKSASYEKGDQIDESLIFLLGLPILKGIREVPTAARIIR